MSGCGAAAAAAVVAAIAADETAAPGIAGLVGGGEVAGTTSRFAVGFPRDARDALGTP